MRNNGYITAWNPIHSFTIETPEGPVRVAIEEYAHVSPVQGPVTGYTLFLALYQNQKGTERKPPYLRVVVREIGTISSPHDMDVLLLDQTAELLDLGRAAGDICQSAICLGCWPEYMLAERLPVCL